ncbi:MAG: GGDEF domain-containing protein, partial [Proteobacteria bacterium]|nr:GGDEF domain-containing protein [Pseudomonadota bacterium]
MGGKTGRRGGVRSELAMLNVPTLWVVFVVNFLALGLVWTYVMRSYPTFRAARYWAAGAHAAAFGAAVAMLRGPLDSLMPLLVGGGFVVFACCLCAMGINQFYKRPVSWRSTALITGGTVAGLVFFLFVYDSVPMRVFVYSFGQSIAMATTLRLVLSPQGERINAGARLSGIVALLLIGVNMIRSACSFLHIGGEVSFVQFNAFQALLVLVLVFLSMAWNFGFLVMAIDRLRNEVADLALVDDLTGVANRRQLLRRLEQA